MIRETVGRDKLGSELEGRAWRLLQSLIAAFIHDPTYPGFTNSGLSNRNLNIWIGLVLSKTKEGTVGIEEFLS